MRKNIPLPLMASIAALPPLAIDMYLAAIPGIAHDLGTEISLIQNSLSIFLLGFGLGLLVFGPCSDRYGRRPMAIFGLTCFALSTLGLTFSTSADMFLSLRFIQGFLGSAATVVIPAMIRDTYGKDTAKGMSAVTMIMLLAPLVAPLVGSMLLTLGEWEIIFQALTVYSFTLLGLTLWLLPETKPEDDDTVPRSFFGSYKTILGKRDTYFDLLCFMLSSLTFFTYITSVSFIYITYFKVSETLFGFLFAFTAASLIVANFINIRVVSRFGPRKMLHLGLAAGLIFSTILVLVTYAEVAYYWTVLCFIFIIGSLGISSINADSLVLIEFPNQASSASAVTGTLRFGFAALAGPILAFIYDGTPLPVVLLIFFTMLGAAISQGLRAWYFRGRQEV